jgi:hypothetical protein
LGVEGFAEELRHLVVEKQHMQDIPKGQRFDGWPILERLFAQRTSDKKTRDQLIERAVSEFGYSQWNWLVFLDLHHSTISRMLALTTEAAKIRTP